VKIKKLETFLANSGLRNYLFLRLTTDSGLTGIGEASLEWQERAVQVLLHDWAESRIINEDPFDVERVIGNMIRDQYQGGATVMTAISGVEIACWDLIGKATGEPVWRLLGGKARESLPAYANGWYGAAATTDEYAEKARQVVEAGYRGLKFDPFGTTWKEMSREEMDRAEAIVAKVRHAVGEKTDILIEVHGRLSVSCAVEMGRRLEKYRPTFYEEPVTPNSLESLLEVKRQLKMPIAAGERLYTLEDFARIIQLRACDVLQPDLTHCGGLWVGKKIAAMAQAHDIRLSPHVSVGPVALCAAVHFGWCTPQVWMQEDFSEFDVPWRNDFVNGWNPRHRGEFLLPKGKGLGMELHEDAVRNHPYVQHSFPSLWDKKWLEEFTQKDKKQ